MFGKERLLVITLLDLRARLARLRALALDRAADRRARDPGRRRRDLPALVRDHPRRVPARERRDRDRADQRHVRDRRRRRARDQRADRRPRRLRVDLLARADRRHPGGASRPTGSCRSRRSRRPAEIDWGGAALLSGGLVALLVAVSEGNAWGWDVAGVPRPDRRRPRSCSRPGSATRPATRSRSSTCG